MDHSKMSHGNNMVMSSNISMSADPRMVHNGHGEMMSMSPMQHDMNMAMYFHGGYNEVILFDFWRISSVGGLVGSMIGCFLLSVLYEALKFYKEHLVRKNFQRMNRCGPRYRRSPAENGENDVEEVSAAGSSEEHSINNPPIRTVETSMWSCGHLTMTLIQMVQITLAYLLMLIFMTYNSWLCASVVVGATFGYFLFGWRKNVVLDDDDQCH